MKLVDNGYSYKGLKIGDIVVKSTDTNINRTYTIVGFDENPLLSCYDVFILENRTYESAVMATCKYWVEDLGLTNTHFSVRKDEYDYFGKDRSYQFVSRSLLTVVGKVHDKFFTSSETLDKLFKTIKEFNIVTNGDFETNFSTSLNEDEIFELCFNGMYATGETLELAYKELIDVILGSDIYIIANAKLEAEDRAFKSYSNRD